MFGINESFNVALRVLGVPGVSVSGSGLSFIPCQPLDPFQLHWPEPEAHTLLLLDVPLFIWIEVC